MRYNCAEPSSSCTIVGSLEYCEQLLVIDLVVEAPLAACCAVERDQVVSPSLGEIG